MKRILVLLLLSPFVAGSSLAAEKKVTIEGVVFDSACLFTKNLTRPVSERCALECAAGGSPLVILAPDGSVYWPIDNKMPAQGQNFRLVKFGGRAVKVTGELYERGGSKAIHMDTVEEAGGSPPAHDGR